MTPDIELSASEAALACALFGQSWWSPESSISWDTAIGRALEDERREAVEECLAVLAAHSYWQVPKRRPFTPTWEGGYDALHDSAAVIRAMLPAPEATT